MYTTHGEKEYIVKTTVTILSITLLFTATGLLVKPVLGALTSPIIGSICFITCFLAGRAVAHSTTMLIDEHRVTKFVFIQSLALSLVVTWVLT